MKFIIVPALNFSGQTCPKKSDLVQKLIAGNFICIDILEMGDRCHCCYNEDMLIKLVLKFTGNKNRKYNVCYNCYECLQSAFEYIGVETSAKSSHTKFMDDFSKDDLQQLLDNHGIRDRLKLNLLLVKTMLID